MTSIERFTNWHIAFKALLFAMLGMLAFAVPHASAQIYQQPAPFPWSLPQIPTGTVMVSTYNRKITEFNQTGTMLGQLDATTGSLEGCSIFDTAENFFVTDYDPQQVMKFDPTGALIGALGGPYGGQCFQEPSSITLDAAGNIYVGQSSPCFSTGSVLEFSSSGTLINTFTPPVAYRHLAGIELAADQCTLFFTTMDPFVHSFNLCTNTELADSPLVPRQNFAHSQNE